MNVENFNRSVLWTLNYRYEMFPIAEDIPMFDLASEVGMKEIAGVMLHVIGALPLS